MNTLFVDIKGLPNLELPLRTVDIELDGYDLGNTLQAQYGDEARARPGLDSDEVIDRLDHVCGSLARTGPKWTPGKEGMDDLIRLLTDCLKKRLEVTALYVRTEIYHGAKIKEATLQLSKGIESGFQSMSVDGIIWETSRASCEGGEDTIHLEFRMVRDLQLLWEE